MAVRRLIALALFLAACSQHGSSPAPTPNDFFLAQHAWCTVAQGGVEFDEDDQFDEIYIFEKDGNLKISTAATNEFHQRQWDENSLIKTTVVKNYAWHADNNQHLILTIGKNDHQSNYTIVKRTVDGKNMNCFTMAEYDNVHCPCAISEEK